ncbi:MAG TPA: glycosyltransferase family 1 protein [Scandinavium sp.]|jgi:mannosyltransferase
MIFVDGIIFSLQRSGGISVYFNELLNHLNKNNECVTHLLYENDNGYTSTYPINSKIRWKISLERFLRVPVSGDQDDIFHSSYYRLPEKKFKGKIVTTVHDFTEELYPRGLNSKVLHLQKRRAILNSDGLICISENTKKDMHRFIPESVRIPTQVIYNGVGDFSSDSLGGSFEPYVIFVGARSGYKNFEMCVSALQDLGGINLIAVGGGQFTSAEQEMLNKIIPGRFSHAGFISESELEKLYQKALALVYPSYYEGFGIPVIEAMKSGCPVIASRSSSITEISGDAALLIENITAEKLKLAILDLKDPTIRNTKIISGITNAEKYSWEKMAFETLSFYNYLRGKK